MNPSAPSSGPPSRPLRGVCRRLRAVPWRRWLVPGLISVAAVWVLGGTDRFPAADGPHMLGQSMLLALDVRDGQVWGAVQRWLGFGIPHPPAGYLPSAVGALLVEPWAGIRGVVAFSGAVCLLLLFEGMVRMARPGPWWGGQAAAVLACGVALTWWSADHYGFDLPAAAAVVQALSWLHASDGLRRGRAAAAFGAWLGVGFLTKYSVPIVCFLPVMVVAVPALVRRPTGVLRALAAWLAVCLPWFLFNGSEVFAYVHSALAPPDVPGNFPEPLTLARRFDGSGQLQFVVALLDGLGWPGLVVAVAAAIRARRRVPLAGLVSGLVFLGAMNSREGRYALPLFFLLAAAGAPRNPRQWKQAVLLALAGLQLLGASLRVYGSLGADEVPARRPLEHVPDRLSRWGRWPWPAEQFMPLSEHPHRWHVEQVVETIGRRAGDDAVVLAILDQPVDAPGISTYQLVSAARGSTVEFLPVHVRLGPGGLQTATYPSPTPHIELAWVVSQPAGRGGGAGEAWLDRNPHRLLEAYSLPHGAQGRLVALEGYVHPVP